MKNKKNKFFSKLQNVIFFFFGPLLLSNLITLLFLIHFKRFKVLQERQLKFYKSYWYFNSKKTNMIEFFWVFKNRPLQCSMVFFEFLTPFTLGDHNFLISNPFSTTLIMLNVPRGGLQVLFGHQNQQNPPLAAIL